MGRKRRTHYSGEKKVEILRRHFLDRVPISDVCEEYGIQPTAFYRWQKQFFENGAAAFAASEPGTNTVAERKVELLEQKLVRKNEVLSELMEAHIILKKELGEI